MPSESILAQAIAEQATPMIGAHSDFDRLVDKIGDSRFVLLGEATHGTHEFYRIRAELTKRLIEEKQFSSIAIEGDWPDAYRVNRFIRGLDEDAAAMEAIDALDEFRRFPRWMWRNADVLDLVGWLRAYNDRTGAPRQVGFYGLDLYSLHQSMAAVIAYLDPRDQEAAQRARRRYACLDVHGEEPQDYGQAVAYGVSEGCEQEVLAQLVDLLKNRERLLQEGPPDGEAHFAATQNARVVANAEEYYRSMYFRGVSTWNLRDTHMADTLEAVSQHLQRRDGNGKMIVWAHNSHVGDSDAMSHRAERDEITIGRLCRERHPLDTVLVGFTTCQGTVTAASEWGGAAERKIVRPALPGSYEALFHRTGVPHFLLMLDQLGEATSALHEARLERAIGVIYRPESERFSHYFDVRLADQLDAVIHIDETRAVEPLERTSLWERGEVMETYPTGL